MEEKNVNKNACECDGNCGENCKCHHNHDYCESSIEERPDTTSTEIHLKTLNGDVFVINGMDIDWDVMIDNIDNMLANIDMLRAMMRDLTNEPDNDHLAIIVHDQVEKFMDGFGIQLTYDNVKEGMSICDSAKCMCFDAITIAYELLNVTNVQMVMNKCTQFMGGNTAMDLSAMLPSGWRLEPDNSTEHGEIDTASFFTVYNVRMYENDYATSELGADECHDAVLDTVVCDSDEDGEYLEINVVATDSDDAINRAESLFEEYYGNAEEETE